MRLLSIVLTAGLVAPLPAIAPVAVAAAQESTSSSAPPTPPQQASNVQLDLAITDSQDGKPVRKTVSMLLGSGTRSVLRSSGQVPVDWPDGKTTFMPVTLNLDAGARIIGGQTINVTATFEFNTAGTAGGGPADSRSPANSDNLTQRIDVYVRSGRPLLVSRSADPLTDRTVTVELTATIREP